MSFVPTLRTEPSVLLATLCCESTAEGELEAATGVAGAVASHRFESGWHAIGEEDAARLLAAATGRDFAERYYRRAAAAAGALLAAARDLAATDHVTEQDLAAGVAAFAAAGRRAAAFGVITPVLGPALATEPTPPAPANAPTPPEEGAVPEALAEVRSCSRLAAAILADPAAAEVFTTTTPQIALRRTEEEFPDLAAAIAAHVREYGWVRTRSYRLAPLTARDLVDRLQVIVLRGDAASVTAMGGPPPGGDSLLRRARSGDILPQAEALVRPLFAAVAGALSCTVEQALFATPAELLAALEGTAPFPLGAVARRFGEGFTVYRRADLEVLAGGPHAYRPEAMILSGMTACRGRAAGPVRILTDQAELDRLQDGDVLVSAASTTDWARGPTVFPTRGGGPDALARAAAVVTDEGGLLSHAAVVCRERGIPAVLATEHATTLLSEGMVVEIDATQPVGRVIVLSAPGPRWTAAGTQRGDP